jgi:hypothetical protein
MQKENSGKGTLFYVLNKTKRNLNIPLSLNRRYLNVPLFFPQLISARFVAMKTHFLMKSTRTMKSPLNPSFSNPIFPQRSAGVDRFRLMLKGWGLKVFSLLLVVMVGGSLMGATVTYTTTSSSTVTTSGSVPSGSSATFSNTYASANQMTNGNSTTLTLSGFAGYQITGITMSMASNGTAGKGSFTAIGGGTTTFSSIANSNFNVVAWNGAYSASPVTISPSVTSYAVTSGQSVALTIAVTTNSLYIYSYTITYSASSGAPSLTLPTSTSISNTSATLGATITANGGANITARGTSFKTVTGVIATDNQSAEGGTSIAAYTHSRTGLAPQTQYFYVGYATNSNGTSISSEGNFRTLSNPPTAQPSSFSTTSGSSSLIANWTTATFPGSGASNTGYALIWAASGTTPTLSSANGVAPTAGAGTLVNITSGSTLSSTISSLANGTSYNLLIIPYTWDGTNAATYNYLTASALTTTGTPAAVSYTWNGGTSGSWVTPSNWTPSTSVAGPTTGDAVIFNSGSTIAIAASVPSVTLSSITISNSGTNVTLGVPSNTSKTLTLSNAATALSIASGTTLSLIGNGTGSLTLAYSGFGNSATIAGTLNLQLGSGTTGAGKYIATNSSTTVSGTMTSNTSFSTLSSSTSNLVFSSTGIFQLAGTTANTIPTATWQTGSTVKLSQSGSSSITMAGLSGQSFSNFTIDATHSGTINFNASGSTISFTINGDYTQSGSPLIELGGGTATTNISVGGAFQKSAGTLSTTTSSTNATVTLTNTSGKNLQCNSSKWVDFTIATTGVYILNGSFTTNANTANFIVNGTLDCNTNILYGGTLTSFTLASGASLKFANTDGITTTGAAGAIQVGNTRTYDPAANYTYNGSLAQVTGTGLPASLTGTVTINNSAGVTMSQNTAFTGIGALVLTAGKLITNAKTLTLVNSTAGSTTSYIVTDATGTVTMNAVSTVKTLPIGTSSSYAPLILTAGSSTAYTTYVSSSVPLAVFDATKSVGLAWSINGSNAPSSVKFQWNSGNEGASFTINGTCDMGRTGSTPTTYTITSLSNAAGTDPNTITASSGFTTGNNWYVIGNTNAVRLDAPIVSTTVAVNSITENAASSGGQTITTSASLTAKGIVWNTSTTPTVALTTKTDEGTSTSNFTSSLTSLSPQTQYYVRAYATNAAGTGYGNEINFRTLSSPVTAQASAFNASATSTSNIDLSWTSATFPSSGATTMGYLLYRASGANTAAFAGSNGTAPSAGANTTLVTTLASNSVSYSNANLDFSTAYNYLLIPFTWDGTNAATYNYLTSSALTASATTQTPVTPVITTTGSLSALSTTYGTASSTSTFSVSGATMDAGITITPPLGFEVSTSSTFSSNVGNNSSPIVIGAAGSIASTPIYVRLLATAGFAGSPFSGNVNLSSINASDVNVATISSTVTKKGLTISGLTANDKVYDGSTSVSVTGTATYSGLVNSESFTVTDIVSWTFTTNGNVGVGKAITQTGAYTVPSNNYSITQPTLTATITAAPLTITASAQSKNFGVTSSTTGATSFTTSGLQGSDAVGTVTLTYSGSPAGYLATATAGSYTITPSAASFTTGSSSNYTITYATGSLTISAVVPGSPTIGAPTAGNGQVTIAFTAPASTGGAAITSYTATSNPGGFTGTGSSSPISVTGLTNGTPYTFTVTATNSAGTGAASSASTSSTPRTVPDAPTIGTAAVAGTSGTATVTFTAPVFDGGASITSYSVTSNPAGGTGSINQAGSGTITVTGLTNGTVYTFTVKATNTAGASAASAASNSVTPYTVPGAPTIGTATAGNGQATVTFTAPASNGGSVILNYTVTSSPAGGSVTGATSPITVTGLTNGTAYTFTVKANNAAGASAASATSNSVTPVLPGPVANAASSVLVDGFTANWDAVTGATGYKLDVSTSSNFAVSSSISEGFEDSTFPPNGWTNSGWARSTTASEINSGSGAANANSNSGTLTTSSISYPTNISFYLGRSGNATAKTLKVEISTTSQSSGFTTIATYDHSNVPSSSYNQYSINLSSYSSNNVVYIRFVKTSSTTAPWRLDDIVVNQQTPSFVSGFQDLTVSGTSQAVTALSEATTYYYRLRATDGSASANSNVITVTTKQTPTVTPTVGTYTYTGSAQGPNTAENTGTGTSYTFSYVGTGATSYPSSSTRPTAVGSYTVTASVAADGNYVAASSSATAFSIAKASSTISLSGTTNFTYSGSAQGPSTSTVSGSTGAVTYSYANSGGTTYGPSATAPTNAGSYTVTATVAADANYETASSSATAFTISKASQTITFASTNSVINGVADFAPGATSASSGINAITYTSSNLSVATIVSGNIHTTGVGQTTITASQASSTNYNAATNATQTLTVNPASAVAYSGTQFTSARNITRGTTELPIYRFQVDVTNADALLNTLTFTTPASITNSNYVNTDITNFKAFLTTSTTFSNSNPLGIVSPSGKVQSNFGEIGISFTSLNTTLSYSTQTYYIWLTADVLSGAVAGRNIIVNAPTIDITGAVSGTISATGIQTIIAGAATNYYLVGTNLADETNWNTDANATPATIAGRLYTIINPNDVNLNIDNESVSNSSSLSLGSNAKLIIKNTGQLTLTAGTINGTIDVENGGTLNINSTSIPTLGALGSTSTVIYSANGNQAVATKTYANLTLDGSGVKTIGAATVTGSLNLNAGILDIGLNTFVINGPTSRTNGTIDADEGTVSFGNVAELILTTSLFSGSINTLAKSSGSGVLILNDNLNVTNLSTASSTGAIILASNKQLTVGGIIDNNGTLTIENGATLKQTRTGADANTGSGTYNVKQNITGSGTTTPNGRFWYVGSPLSNGSSSALLSNSNQLWQWNEGTFGYTPVTNGLLTQGKSYVLRSGQNETINFSGTILSNGTVSVSPLSRTGTSQQFRGCHLVSNPYPSYLDWDLVEKTNISTTMYVRTALGTNYNVLETYNSSDHIGTSISGPEMTKFIAPMQGFWVKVTADNLTGTLTMNNTMRDHLTSGSGLRSSAIDFPAFLRFNILDGQNKDQVILFMSPDATAGIDGHDSEKMSASGFAQFYSTVNAKKLVINGMKNVKAKTSVPLTLEMPTSKSYTFQAEEFNIEDGLILLEDKQEGLIQDLTINPTYSFFGNAGTNTTRFVVHFQLSGAPVLVGGPMELESLGSDELTTDNIQIVSNNQGTVIIRLDEGFKPEGSIRIFDASGRLVEQTDFNDQETTIQLNEQAGMYFVEVAAGKLMVKKKIVIN